MTKVIPKVRLLHVTTVPESLGFLNGQADYMRSRGFEFYALSSPGRLLTHYAQQERVAVFAVEMQRRITPLRDLRAVVEITRIIRGIRPHVVHAYTPKGGLLGMLGAWLARTPVRIYHMMGLPMITATGYRRRLLKWTEWLSCTLSNQVLCVSHGIREMAIHERLCWEHKIKVLANGSINGVDSQVRFNPTHLGPTVRDMIRSSYGISAESVVVGYLGRVVRDKGLRELAEAWAMIADRVDNCHLLIVGQFEPQDALPHEVERYLGTGPRIHMTGYVEDNVPLYQAMDMLVLPTHREGFPVVPLEAAAMGLPVIATMVPGCMEAVEDNVTGTLVPPYDAGALAEAIQKYIDSPELRHRLGCAGRERVMRDFQPTMIWEAVYNEYARLLQAKGIDVSEQATE